MRGTEPDGRAIPWPLARKLGWGMAGDPAETIYCFGTYRLVPHRRQLTTGKGEVAIHSRAFEILLTLVEHGNRTVSKDEILRVVWPGTFVEENNLRVHIFALRKLLGHEMIATVPGRGYRLTQGVTLEGGPAAADQPAPDQQANVDLVPPSAAPQEETSLPKPAAPLIGRAAALAEVTQLLERHRLVTITGPSGIGKTRLALELGWAGLARYEGEVRLVDLAPVVEPELVAGTVAAALDIAPGEREPSADVIAEAMRGRRMLLVLDNCEHLIGAAAALVEALLAGAPDISILATSQEWLRLAGEQVYRLAPLALPPAEGDPASDEAARFGAVELFVNRVQAIDPSFTPTGDKLAVTAEICRSLDGIPLALEMAAARAPFLGLNGLQSRLGERLRVLSLGRRTAAARHSTLRATVEWSHELLEEPERVVFRRLGIFAGSFTLEAAAAIAADDAFDEWEVIDSLGRLADKSMVTTENTEPPRYRLLETLRLLALEKLDEQGERRQLAEGHARYYAALFTEAYESWESMADADWTATFAPELDNVRAALDWALEDAAGAPIAVTLAGSSALLWRELSLYAEGRSYTDRAERLIDETRPSAAAAWLLTQIGALWQHGDQSRALTALERSEALFQQLGDELGMAKARAGVGILHAMRGEPEKATLALSEARQTLARRGRTRSLSNVVNTLGALAFFIGDTEAARDHFEQAWALTRSQRNPLRESMMLNNLAEVEFNLGAVGRAVGRAKEAVSLLRAAGKRFNLGWALSNLASYLLVHGALDEARAAAREALELVRAEGGLIVRVCLQQWAALAALRGHPTEAARLAGFVDAAYEAAGEPRQPTEQQIHERLTAALRDALTVDRIAALGVEGAAMAEGEAVAIVCDRLIPSLASQ